MCRLAGWLKALLSNRTQVANVNDSFSYIVHITSGVPQGSVLGPTLFLLLITTTLMLFSLIHDVCNFFRMMQKLYSSFNSTSVDLQIMCEKLVKSADKWQTRTAFNKCSMHRISNRERHFTVNPVYRISGSRLDKSYQTRDLGIIIDNKLNFNCHVSRLAHNAHVRAYLILRTFVSRDPVNSTKAFITYARPLLEYCRRRSLLKCSSQMLDWYNKIKHTKHSIM